MRCEIWAQVPVQCNCHFMYKCTCSCMYIHAHVNTMYIVCAVQVGMTLYFYPEAYGTKFLSR